MSMAGEGKFPLMGDVSLEMERSSQVRSMSKIRSPPSEDAMKKDLEAVSFLGQDAIRDVAQYDDPGEVFDPDTMDFDQEAVNLLAQNDFYPDDVEVSLSKDRMKMDFAGFSPLNK